MQRNQEDIQLFEGLTCMTLGEDDDTPVQENMHAKKLRHPIQDVKLATARTMGNASRGQSHPTGAVEQHVPNPSAQVQLVPGDNIPSRHRIFLPQRSGMHPICQMQQKNKTWHNFTMSADSCVLEAFKQLAHGDSSA